MQMDSTLDTYDSGGEEDEAEEVLGDDLKMPPGLPAPSVEASDPDSNAAGAMPTPSIAGVHPTDSSAQSAVHPLQSQPRGETMFQHQQHGRM